MYSYCGRLEVWHEFDQNSKIYGHASHQKNKMVGGQKQCYSQNAAGFFANNFFFPSLPPPVAVEV